MNSWWPRKSECLLADTKRFEPKRKLDLHVTLWPSFDHFEDFCYDERLAGIRLNSAMMHGPELDKELKIVERCNASVPLYFDIKGRQLRVTEAIIKPSHLELKLNHPIEVETPQIVLFKAGNDKALLKEVHGNHLIFEGGPRYLVKEGESLHIRHPSLEVGEPIFCDREIEKIKKVVQAGFTRYYLSYVEDIVEVQQLRQMIGLEAELILKIETVKGLEFVENYNPMRNTTLMAARGDLYVEIDRPHEIVNALESVLDADQDAYVGSRILLSCIHNPVPDCADFMDLAYLETIGYKNFLLCDELCLKGDLLGRAVNVFDAYRNR